METDLTDNGSCWKSQSGDDCHGSSALIFLGTGSSGMVPNAMCLIQPTDSPCSVCTQALTLPPDCNPNYRCNTSLLIDFCHDDRKHKYVLIDVGKSFREQVIRWFTCHKIPRVDSIILTHEHANAVFGLDDIRAIQPFSPMNDIDPTPIYLTQFCMDSIAAKFPYLVKKKIKEGEEIRRVAQLEWKIIEENCDKPFIASGLQFVPLPVMHGEDYVSLGFLFGEKSRVAYVSDVSRFPPSTEYVISKSGGGQLDLLILDSLFKKGPHNTHLCLPQTLDAVKRICPKRALFVGMTHEFDHQKDNENLMEWSRRNPCSACSRWPQDPYRPVKKKNNGLGCKKKKSKFLNQWIINVLQGFKKALHSITPLLEVPELVNVVFIYVGSSRTSRLNVHDIILILLNLYRVS